MLTWIIDQSLKHRFAVLALVFACAAIGFYSLQRLDIDAFPDTTPVQVQINTNVPALGPEEIERQISLPIEQALSGLPRLSMIRSVSYFGVSQVVVTFEEGTDIYFARQLVNERLSSVELPEGIERPKMGPISTGLGEVFHYVVAAADPDQTRARTVHDWNIRPQSRSVPGVAEVNYWGGFAKQYLVRIDPGLLIKYGLTYSQVLDALAKNNRNVGGGNVERGSEIVLVHGLGRPTNLEQIENIVIPGKAGPPIYVKNVATVEIGHEVRRGAVTANGRGEVVLGLGFMLMGENSHTVTRNLKAQLNELTPSLPRNVKVTPVYDRTELIDHVIDTARKNLFEGGLLVIAVLFAFLGNLRAAAIVAVAIPLSMLFAFSGMLRFGISASLLSLGAIDFGMIVDSSVVMVENCVRKLQGEEAGDESTRLEIIRDAAVEVRQPTLFGELIILIVYLPILTLEGIEGRLFRPMALTVIFALIGSMILSMTLMPVLASFFLPRRIEHREPILLRMIKGVYAPLLRLAMRFKWVVLVFAAMTLAVVFGLIAPRLGSEFIPKLSEGAIAIGIVRQPGTSLAESVRGNTEIENLLLSTFPDEIKYVWSRVGTAEVATDPMGIELTDTFIILHPRERWKKATDQDELTTLIEHLLREQIGTKKSYSQPIEMRMNEMQSGTRADVAIKLFGDNLEILKTKSQEVEAVLQAIPGSADVNLERLSNQPVLQVKLKPRALAQYGIPAKVVLDLVESLGGIQLGEIVEDQTRFALMARLPVELGRNPNAVRGILVPTPNGERIPLTRLADVEEITGPSTINHEKGKRVAIVSCNVRGRDIGSFVADARKEISEQVVLPEGGRYHFEFGGQYEQLITARKRLMIVVPVALILIFTLLYLTYRSTVDTLRVFTGVPFAWVGGVLALWLRDMPFSISAAIGFIALSGVAVLDDMILVSTVRQLRLKGLSLDQAVEKAALMRLRPVLMTSLVASLGFVPMAFSTGIGAEVQRPLATVVIGGVISAMVMSLLVVRVLYVVFQRPRSDSAGSSSEGSE
ncbi:MAG: CusA/CzcA family heavy metal efflux RND transporter [Planctomycetes bacterium]|nr:CusA/CzcA family heavy metal efflux RND transporter [Planctomycetota bacterium]